MDYWGGQFEKCLCLARKTFYKRNETSPYYECMTGRELVNRYGEEALYQTPLENPYVIELIEKLGFYTVEDFLEKSDILTRDFGTAAAGIK